MQIQISVTNPSPAVLAALFGQGAAEVGETTTDAPPAAEPGKKRGRRSNAEIAAAEAAAKAGATAADDGLGLGDDLGGDDGLGDAPAKEIDLESELIPAFKAYVAKCGSRDKAVALLASYKCQSVRELPKDKYAEVLAKLKK